MSGIIGPADMDMDMDMDMSMGAVAAGRADGGSQYLRPIGVSPAITKQEAEGESWWRGNKWPPTDMPVVWQNAPILKESKTSFPGRPWAAKWYSIAVLGEFVQQQGWNSYAPRLKPILDRADVVDELKQLAALMDYRPAVMSEILAQLDNFILYFRAVLSFTPASHPWTNGLATIALKVGEFQVMHYKAVFNRPRPSTLSPILMPPIDVPGHASYPSGHSTQSHLVAMMLGKVMPKAASEALASGSDRPDPALGPLQRLAERVARNREVLGVHYPSDSEGGRELAIATFPLLMQCPTVQTILKKAKAEW